MFSWNKLLIPDKMEILSDKITLKKAKLFGLGGTEEQVLFSKIASVRLDKGLFTGTVIIETYGGVVTDLRLEKLIKENAVELASAIEEPIK